MQNAMSVIRLCAFGGGLICIDRCLMESLGFHFVATDCLAEVLIGLELVATLHGSPVVAIMRTAVAFCPWPFAPQHSSSR